MRDSELINRPVKGWTPWEKGAGLAKAAAVWWDARELHFAKLNVSVLFSGSELVAIEHWGFRPAQWCMKKPPADHPPMPEAIVRLRQQAAEEALERFRAEKAAERAAMAAQQATEKRQRARGAAAV
ncbi:MAG: hypothetical protein EOR67_16160 [Mesorhizobium sp.]|uniref:hypothetical protein n=1 Tax=Mesorhizobium sp. TaxID=1871066 RepID=UPI000FE7B147|nr:hypothetical protein [Mesorhizobium sp.]RWL87731.1 MAG: hypothetical protein EOR67_16160 [Mesorhizobium sp.]